MDVMIIWLDGTYGIGKSTVAQKIKEKLSDVEIEILESDHYYQEMINENEYLPSGGTRPQNNQNFIKRFKKVLDEKIENQDKKLIIIVMSVTHPVCKNQLFDVLSAENSELLHIILTAKKETIEARIQLDENRDKDFSLQWLEPNLNFLEKNFDEALRISTENKSSSDTADEIIQYVD